jgi:predicted nucleotidyltransferase
VAIVLVGSRADGRARPGSDWDLHVILRDGPAGVGGPIPRPEESEGDLLEVGLLYLPAACERVLDVFGANLRQARVLLDDAAGVAHAICASAHDRYRRGRGL